MNGMEKSNELSQLPHGICHCCKLELTGDILVPCKSETCHHFFCRKCLTSHYKYSKAKTARLPSLKWKCPICKSRCYCDECINAGYSQKPKKQTPKPKKYKKKNQTNISSQSKGIKKTKLQKNPNLSAFSTVASSQFPSPCNLVIAPPTKKMLPDFNCYTPSQFSFSALLAEKDSMKEYNNSMNQADPLINNFNLKRTNILDFGEYNRMSTEECLRLAYQPFCISLNKKAPLN